METSLIEQLDQKRYNLLKWGTIGFSIYFGTYLLTELPLAPLVVESMPWFRVPGYLIFIVSTVQIMRLRRALSLNRKTKKALEGEIYQLNQLKSFRNGFIVVMVITLISYNFTLFSAIHGLLITKITLYFGTLTVLISKLFYNRG